MLPADRVFCMPAGDSEAGARAAHRKRRLWLRARPAAVPVGAPGGRPARGVAALTRAQPRAQVPRARPAGAAQQRRAARRHRAPRLHHHHGLSFAPLQRRVVKFDRFALSASGPQRALCIIWSAWRRRPAVHVLRPSAVMQAGQRAPETCRVAGIWGAKVCVALALVPLRQSGTAMCIRRLCVTETYAASRRAVERAYSIALAASRQIYSTPASGRSMLSADHVC